MVMTTIDLIVGPNGTVQVPAELARPGDTVTLHVDLRDTAESKHQAETATTETDEPVRLTRLTAKTPEQKEQLRRQIDELIDQLAPRLKDMPDHADLLYGEDGLPK
jgi:hypothetical protein